MTFDQFLKLPLLHPAGPLSAELQRKFDTTIVHNHFHACFNKHSKARQHMQVPVLQWLRMGLQWVESVFNYIYMANQKLHDRHADG